MIPYLKYTERTYSIFPQITCGSLLQISGTDPLWLPMIFNIEKLPLHNDDFLLKWMDKQIRDLKLLESKEVNYRV